MAIDQFGGRPTERLPSHAHAPNKVRLARQHAKLRSLLRDTPIPTAEDERDDPSAAHDVYCACTKYLIGRTRDDRMVFQENVNFGFRRNLWGLKSYGIGISVASTVILGLRLYMELSGHLSVSPLLVGFEILNILMLCIWVMWVTPAWVMIPANAYGERLLDTLETMEVLQ